MFPHTVTVYNVIESDDKHIYNRTEVNNVFIHIDKIISPEGRGEKYISVYDVIFSNEALQNYLPRDEYMALQDKTNNYTLRENDIIAIGSFGEITGLNELQLSNLEFFLIKTISDNRYGDNDLQNIEVTD